MMHLLNPIFERSSDQDWQDSRGSWFKPMTYFVSCSCGWYYVNLSKREAEDSWMYHVKTINTPQVEMTEPLFTNQFGIW